MKYEQCKREADRRLKPPADFWSWCYSQITTYRWSNKDKTIIASDLDLGHCIEKRLTKSSRLTFYDKTYFFSIILSTSKRIEIQSYEFSSKLVEGKQFIDFQLTNLERFPGILLSVGESIQLKILFYKKLRDFTTDRFLTFRESDWKFFIRDLVNEFAH